VLARFVPVMRTFAPLAAGTARYDYKAFALWNVAGALGWAISVTLLGNWLGGFTFIAKNIDVIAVVIVLASVAPSAVEILRRRRKARREAMAE
jgi:membrane-associated protein